MRALVCIATALVLIGACQAALAEVGRCAPREVIVQGLAGQYGETSVISAMTPGHLFEVWASSETGTWTAFSTTPGGLSCFIASGREFHILTPVSATEDEDA